MKPILLVFAALLLSLAIGCGRVGIAFVDQNSQPLVPEVGDGWLMFDLQRCAKVVVFRDTTAPLRPKGKRRVFSSK
jgi:hypothetical protein